MHSPCCLCISGRMLSSVLQTVCQSLSDSNRVVRSAALFAIGQFSEHLQVCQDTHLYKLQLVLYDCTLNNVFINNYICCTCCVVIEYDKSWETLRSESVRGKKWAKIFIITIHIILFSVVFTYSVFILFFLAWSQQVLCRVDAFAVGLHFIFEWCKGWPCH